MENRYLQSNLQEKAEHFTLKADVTDFALPSTTTYATPSLLGSLKLDDNKDLNDVEEGLDDLAKRAKAYDQFTGLSDEMDGSVTFILITEKIEK